MISSLPTPPFDDMVAYLAENRGEAPMVDASGIYEHPSRHPQQNFSSNGTRRNPEARFAEKFALAYRDRFTKIHWGTTKWTTLFVREVPVFGNGIPDLLVLNWSHAPGTQVSACLELEELHPTVRAFEFKLSNWRKGLMQAHRYKYFSHASILVLPSHKMKSVESQIDIFRKLRVGLWGFSPETGSIVSYYTPRPTRQQTAKYGQEVIRLATEAVRSQFGSLLKLSQTIQ